MMKISWTEKKSNEEILNMIGMDRMLIKVIKKRKMAYFGHLMRRSDGLQRLLLDGKIEGKRDRGRQRLIWTDNIMEWTGEEYDRTLWRSMTVDLLRADGT